MAAAFISTTQSSCGIYRFKSVSVPDSIKNFKLNFIENRAQYVNPQLAQKLTEKFRQKIVSQTRLINTNNDNADWVISGIITEYTFSTSGISGGQSSSNRLTVGVTFNLLNQKAADQPEKEYRVTRNIDVGGSFSLQEIDNTRTDVIIKEVIDDVFNQIFAAW